MTIETFGNVVRWAFRSTERPAVHFIFHGGEPTLLGESWFADAVSVARHIADEFGKRASFSIQSNGVRIEDGLLRLFAAERIALGISVDGPSIDRSMRPSLSSAVDTLNRATRFGIKPGVLMTVNHSNWDNFHAIYEWLRDELRISVFKANPVSSVGLGERLVDLPSAAMVAAAVSLLECMLADRGTGPIEENLARELLRFFGPDSFNDRYSLCHGRPCGAGSTVVSVTPDGRVLPCGRFAHDDDAFVLGSVEGDESSASAEVVQEGAEAVRAFHAQVPMNWVNCATCQARHICSFGCQAFIVRSKTQVNLECLPTIERHRYYVANADRLKQLVPLMAERLRSSAAFDDATDYNDRDLYSDYSDRR